MRIVRLATILLLVRVSTWAQKPDTSPVPQSLLQVKRVYVAPLTGGPPADALRELIIASLDSTKLFVLTDNEDRADAILKGAADNHTYEESHDKIDSANGHVGGSLSNGSYYSRSGIGLNEGGGASEAYHIKERKHEAYAAVRLCNRDGDVLWSTTQESNGGKFHGASEEVAAKIARQIQLDYEKARHAAMSPAPVVPSASNTPTPAAAH
jgi:hypothetical protein